MDRGREEETLILTTSVKGLHMDHGGGVARGKNVVLGKTLPLGALSGAWNGPIVAGQLAKVEALALVGSSGFEPMQIKALCGVL